MILPCWPCCPPWSIPHVLPSIASSVIVRTTIGMGGTILTGTDSFVVSGATDWWPTPYWLPPESVFGGGTLETQGALTFHTYPTYVMVLDGRTLITDGPAFTVIDKMDAAQGSIVMVGCLGSSGRHQPGEQRQQHAQARADAGNQERRVTAESRFEVVLRAHRQCPVMPADDQILIGRHIRSQ